MFAGNTRFTLCHNNNYRVKRYMILRVTNEEKRNSNKGSRTIQFMSQIKHTNVRNDEFALHLWELHGERSIRYPHSESPPASCFGLVPPLSCSSRLSSDRCGRRCGFQDCVPWACQSPRDAPCHRKRKSPHALHPENSMNNRKIGNTPLQHGSGTCCCPLHPRLRLFV